MKKAIVKKIKKSDDGMLPEYDFSKGVRGKYYKKFREGITITVFSSRKKQKTKSSSLVVLEPDVALKFKNSKEVNNALRNVIAAKGR